jgi:hypothetical protein
MNEPVRHHYIPQFYLREWAGPDKQVFWYHRPVRRVVVDKALPKNIAFEPHLYTVSSKADPQMLEKKFFGEIDNYAALVLQRLSRPGPKLGFVGPGDLKEEQRIDGTRFIQSLHLRNPHSLTEIKTVLDQAIRETMERNRGAAYRAARQPHDPESVYDYALSDEPELFADAHKIQLTKLIDYGPLGGHIINMIWAVLDVSDSPHPLLTSDRPYILPCGLREPVCVLSVPISPTRIFLAANDRAVLETVSRNSSRDNVRTANHNLVRLAVDDVYGNTKDRREFVEKRLRKLGQNPLAGLVMGPG